MGQPGREEVTGVMGQPGCEEVTGVMGQPSREELREAFQAGFDSIDDGEGFYPGFHGYLEHHGYILREDIACTCVDRGAHGHQPECRWVRG